ncbi:glycosyltransferase [Mesorhizobium sp. KR2-14]|uniref:glycosyltransferase n=1 Tax=Mesorhizobium sp. KR2-14 TaxID=3156610 RepID=UPI0032B43CDA
MQEFLKDIEPFFYGKGMREKIGRRIWSAYNRLPVSARAAIPRTAKRWLQKRIGSVANASPLVKAFDDKLWGGFSRSALIDLATIKANEALPAADRAEACYSLARWHAVQGDFSAALKEMEDRRAINLRIAHQKRQFMLEALFLCRLGRAEEARALIERYYAGKSFDTSVQLMLANTWNPAVTGVRTAESEAKVLEYINAVYRHFGLAEIEKRDPNGALSIDNLRGKHVKKHFDPGNKVTVIVPAYNAEGTILTALTSLAEQSWQNLEVLVVDDCSTDNTAAVVEAFCKTDERFRLIRQTVNGGSYTCRNRALEEARGAYITIHDSDDFAHPDRIFSHIRHAETSNIRYNLSKWGRVLSDLTFVGVWMPREDLTNPNMGSFFVHRGIFEMVGGWDDVRVSGDREFVRRVEAFCGGRNRDMVADGCPLVFGRVSETSLTQSKDTSLSTIYNGVRREYHEATDYVHENYSVHEIRSLRARKIPRPSIIDVGGHIPRFDILFIGDWNMKGGTFHSAFHMAKAAGLDGMKIGVLHYCRYDLDVARPLSHDVRAVFYNNNITIISPGEKVVADNVVITYPAMLQHLLDRFPSIKHEKLFVVVNQMGERDTKGDDVAYDPVRVREHLVEYFGHEGDWVPISNRVRKIMEEDPRYPQPHKNTWTPMVDVDEWMIGRPRWRGKERDLPVIGRHGRDHPLKWPGNRTSLLDAYCADKPCKLRFLGGARHAEKLAGRRPANWQVDPFGSRDVKEFLVDLDFFIHYPHEDYIEEFGRAPMEAMAIGVPVILPPVFRGTFGEAALYAEPADVWPLIEKLWADEKKWLDRLEAGRDFVKKNCSYDAFPPRLQ